MSLDSTEPQRGEILPCPSSGHGAALCPLLPTTLGHTNYPVSFSTITLLQAALQGPNVSGYTQGKNHLPSQCHSAMPSDLSSLKLSVHARAASGPPPKYSGNEIDCGEGPRAFLLPAMSPQHPPQGASIVGSAGHPLIGL